jgi:hypothetical protein
MMIEEQVFGSERELSDEVIRQRAGHEPTVGVLN